MCDENRDSVSQRVLRPKVQQAFDFFEAKPTDENPYGLSESKVVKMIADKASEDTIITALNHFDVLIDYLKDPERYDQVHQGAPGSTHLAPNQPPPAGAMLPDELISPLWLSEKAVDDDDENPPGVLPDMDRPVGDTRSFDAVAKRKLGYVPQVSGDVFTFPINIAKVFDTSQNEKPAGKNDDDTKGNENEKIDLTRTETNMTTTTTVENALQHIHYDGQCSHCRRNQCSCWDQPEVLDHDHDQKMAPPPYILNSTAAAAAANHKPILRSEPSLGSSKQRGEGFCRHCVLNRCDCVLRDPRWGQHHAGRAAVEAALIVDDNNDDNNEKKAQRTETPDSEASTLVGSGCDSDIESNNKNKNNNNNNNNNHTSNGNTDGGNDFVVDIESLEGSFAASSSYIPALQPAYLAAAADADANGFTTLPCERQDCNCKKSSSSTTTTNTTTHSNTNRQYQGAGTPRRPMFMISRGPGGYYPCGMSKEEQRKHAKIQYVGASVCILLLLVIVLAVFTHH